MKRKVAFKQGEFYHLYNRGTDKRKIFMDPADHWRFIYLLYLCNGSRPVRVENILERVKEKKKNSKVQKGPTLLKIFDEERGKELVDIGAYCLMSNHFHLLVYEKNEGGTSEFMKKLSTAYAMYFNRKYERSGALFEGRFKAQHVNKDNYLRHLFGYIHLNPVTLIDSKWKEEGVRNKKETKNFLQEYLYSSYLDYTGVRKKNPILNKSAFPSYFKDQNFNDFIESYLSYSEDSKDFQQGRSLLKKGSVRQ
jgi:putative transposase